MEATGAPSLVVGRVSGFLSAVTVSDDQQFAPFAPSEVTLTPWPPVEGALLFGRFRVYPLEKAVHVKDVCAFAPDCVQEISYNLGGYDLLSGQSSPGTLHAGQQLS